MEISKLQGPSFAGTEKSKSHTVRNTGIAAGIGAGFGYANLKLKQNLTDIAKNLNTDALVDKYTKSYAGNSNLEIFNNETLNSIKTGTRRLVDKIQKLGDLTKGQKLVSIGKYATIGAGIYLGTKVAIAGIKGIANVITSPFKKDKPEAEQA